MGYENAEFWRAMDKGLTAAHSESQTKKSPRWGRGLKGVHLGAELSLCVRL